MQKKYMSRFLLLVFISLISGCDTLEKALKETDNMNAQPEFVITVNQIVDYPRARQLERQIPSFNGREIWVNMNPYIHSRNIEEIKLIDRKDKPGFYDLMMKLDRRGRILWMQLSVQFRNQELAFVIDGVFYREFKPERATSEDDLWVEVKGPFDGITAKALEKYAKKNYEHFNK